MKAITLRQPWAQLMITKQADGRFCKIFETRSWPTKYRGEIAIHSSAGMRKADTQAAVSGPFFEALSGEAPWPLPKGLILGIGDLVECLPVEEALRHSRMTIPEQNFGDYTAGRFAFLIDNMKLLTEPVKAKGMLGLWEWPMNEEVQRMLLL